MPADDTTNGTAKKVSGPASYFPSIEKTYGEPMDVWFARIRERPEEKHMETVSWLKSEYGMGHGHANAMVAYVRAQDA